MITQNDQPTTPDNAGKPAAFTAEILASIPCNGGSYLRAPSNVRVYYGQIAAAVLIKAPDLYFAHQSEQIDAIGAREWFDKAESPIGIPYSFSGEIAWCPAGVIVQELRTNGSLSFSDLTLAMINGAAGITAQTAEGTAEAAIRALKSIGAIAESNEDRIFRLTAEPTQADREYAERCREQREGFERARAGYNPDGTKIEQVEGPKDRDIIAELEQKIADDLTKIDREARFDESINESYSFEKIGGPFAHMQPAAVLKECDPTAYRCGVNDYADTENWTEVAGGNYDGREVEEKRDELIEELESEIADLEEEIEAIEEEATDDEDPDIDGAAREVSEKNAEIANLAAHIARLKSHSF